MNIKNFFIGLLLIGTLSFNTGCTTLSTGKNSGKEEIARNKVENVEDLIGENIRNKVENVANISYGIDYVLTKEEDPSKFVKIAKDLNSRIMSLTGAPTLEEIKTMRQMIDDLTSQLKTEQERGKKTLGEKDLEISNLQTLTKTLEVEKDKEIKKYMKIAADTAEKADAIQEELDEYTGWFGLKAVWKGLSQFFRTSMWVIVICVIIFIFLRFASLTSPIAASIFSIFNQIGSWFINIIQTLTPKAITLAGSVSSKLFNSYKITTKKIVDAIQFVKVNAESNGKEPLLKDVLDELAKSLNSEDKNIVESLKKELNWK